VALAEVAGWELEDNTIRRLCHAIAGTASESRQERATAKAVSQAEGDFELQIDAGKVDTQEGWRDVKVAVFDRRKRGEPTAEKWDERDLPAPAVRSVVAAVEEVGLFGERCAQEAEWVRNLSVRHFPGAQGVLDFWHGAEHIADGAKAACGQSDKVAKWSVSELTPGFGNG
jgi:hypothetical protein